MTIVESARPSDRRSGHAPGCACRSSGRRNGGVLGVESFATTTAGFAELHDWFAGFGTLARVGVEGTGAYGAGLARHLRSRGVTVIEVDRPNRQLRRRAGKSDTIDAIEAARAALSGRASGIAKTADGDVEAIRVLLVARRSGRNVRIKYLNQIRHLGFTAPDDLRERLRGVHRDQLARTAAALRPNPQSDVVTYATKLAIAHAGPARVGTRRRTARASTHCSSNSSTGRRRPCSRSTASGSTPPQSCSSPLATIPTGSPPKPPSRICAASRRSPRRPARRHDIASTAAATAKPTMHSGASCSRA